MDDAIELGEIFGFNSEFEFDKSFGAGLALRGGIDGFDIGAFSGHGLGHGGQEAVAVLCRYQ